MSKHTPGPWTVGKKFKGGQGKTTPILWRAPGPRKPENSGTYLVAWLFDGSLPGQAETAVANARLVAAAPDLLGACEAAMKHLPPGGLLSQLADAVAKAKGESPA